MRAKANKKLLKLKNYALFIHHLGFSEILTKYRLSPMGPFWVVAANAIVILGLYVVYSRILKVQTENYFVYLSLGIISWTTIVATITESCNAFVKFKDFALNFKSPLWVYVVSGVYTQFLLWIHNIPFLTLVFFLNSDNYLLVPVQIFLTIFGALVSSLILVPICILLSGYCIKYKDLTQAITVGLQCLLFVTPVLWDPQQSGGLLKLISLLNPFSHLLNIYRGGINVQISTFFNFSILGLISIFITKLIFDSGKNPLSRYLVKKL